MKSSNGRLLLYVCLTALVRLIADEPTRPNKQHSRGSIIVSLSRTNTSKFPIRHHTPIEKRNRHHSISSLVLLGLLALLLFSLAQISLHFIYVQDNKMQRNNHRQKILSLILAFNRLGKKEELWLLRRRKIRFDR